MKKIIYALFLLPSFAIAQESGVHFEHDLNWEQVQAKAKKEKKLIFMDCFTTWCGPCRYMAANIFPQAELGTYFNDHFINIKVQLDTTQADNAQVKSWYKTGADLAAKYNVRAYPTYLFFDASGNAVHRAVGAYEATDFLVKAKDAVDPSKQYYTMLAKYNKGDRSPSLLLPLARTAHESYDGKNMKKITDDYLATQKDFLTKDNIQFLYDFTEHSGEMGFALMQQHEDAFDAIEGTGKTKQRVLDIIKYDEIYPRAFNDNGELPNWEEIADIVAKKYPAYAAEAIAGAKVAYYQNQGDWANFQTTVVEYVSDYGENIGAQDLDGFAWNVFQNCSDIKCVEQALEWSKRSITMENNPAFMDTYANILYRLGKKDEAISWEQKAMDLVNGVQKKGFEETIEKMKNGDKTWNGE